MKISNEQKKKNRKKIIKTAVDLIIEKGFKSTTMRDISKKAGIGDATIYNYFPTKESILFGYYEDNFSNAVEKLKSIDGFNEYSLQEQLQTFFETKLDLYLPDREFIEETFNSVFFTLGQHYTRLKPIRNQFMHILDDIFNAAIEVGEIPDQAFREIINQLFWDYFIGVVAYWLRDQSDQFSDTTLLIDKTLDIGCAVLKAGVVNKVFDMASFMFKNHILSRMSFFRDNLDTVHKIKREFMGEKNDK